MKREIVWTSQFKKDYKLAAKRHLAVSYTHLTLPTIA